MAAFAAIWPRSALSLDGLLRLNPAAHAVKTEER
jgi:hypothetical protein